MSTPNDTWIRAALEPARRLEPTDAEVAAALARAGTRTRRAPHGGRAVAVALACGLLVAAGGAAATGVLPVGSVIRGEGFHSGSQTVKETVVATGKTPVSGPWQMTVFKTERGVHCLKLKLLERPAAGPRSSGYCGGIVPFAEFGQGGRRVAARRGEVLLYGKAPGKASAVELIASGDVKISARTHAGPAGTRGVYWLVAAPPGLQDARLEWIDRDGRAGRGRLDVSYRFAGPSARTVVASGTTPGAGRWQLIAYESKRGSYDGDIYEPEGLPCIELVLLDPPAPNAPAGIGGCGELRRAPGFFRTGIPVRAPGSNKIEKQLIAGRAPREADAVRLTADGGVDITVKTKPGPPGIPSSFWFIVTPPTLKNGHVYWLDSERHTRGPAVVP